MTWFAVSALVSIRKATERSGPWLVYENVILIEAGNADEANLVASRITREEVAVDDGFTIDGDSAVKEFAGIRKTITVSNPYPHNLDQDRPVTGTEITYSLFRVEGQAELEKLAKGDELTVRYVE
jgi:hypothetical protein